MRIEVEERASSRVGPTVRSHPSIAIDSYNDNNNNNKDKHNNNNNIPKSNDDDILKGGDGNGDYEVGSSGPGARRSGCHCRLWATELIGVSLGVKGRVVLTHPGAVEPCRPPIRRCAAGNIRDVPPGGALYCGGHVEGKRVSMTMGRMGWTGS